MIWTGTVSHAGSGSARPAGPQISRNRVVENKSAKSRQHLVEMIAAIEMSERHEFQRHANSSVAPSASQHAEHKLRSRHKGRGENSAHHIERAVRQIDESMMPNTSVSPPPAGTAAGRTATRFSDCSTRISMDLQLRLKNSGRAMRRR